MTGQPEVEPIRAKRAGSRLREIAIDLGLAVSGQRQFQRAVNNEAPFFEREALPEDAAGNASPVQSPCGSSALPASLAKPPAFIPVKLGWYVQQGMRIGYVTDLFGKTLWDARAPSSGRGPVYLRRALDEER
jgi:hypothetical protein